MNIKQQYKNLIAEMDKYGIVKATIRNDNDGGYVSIDQIDLDTTLKHEKIKEEFNKKVIEIMNFGYNYDEFDLISEILVDYFANDFDAYVDYDDRSLNSQQALIDSLGFKDRLTAGAV